MSKTLKDLLPALEHALPYILGVAAVLLVLLLVVVLWRVLRRRARRRAKEGAQGLLHKAAADLRLYASSTALRRAFDDSLALLERAVPGPGGRYRVPWVLLMGEARSGKTTLLQGCGLDRPLGEPVSAGPEPCGWWLFQQGLVLDLSGDIFLRRDGRTSDGETWRAVLRLIEQHRSRRPLDGIVLTLPASQLYGAETSGSALLDEAAQRSSALYRKLWELQSTLGMRLPIYVVITESDLLPGFSAFCGLLPEGVDRQMFGWSSPDAPATAYSPAWVDRLFSQILGSLGQALVAVLGGRDTTAGSEEAFQVARSIAALREPVRIYLNQIFLSSAYHEGFPLRGLYFAGGRFGGSGAADLALWGTRPTPTPGGHGAERPSEILFAHDVLANKVFPEAPVGRPTEVALRQRRRARLSLAAATAAILLLGVVGLPAGSRITGRTAAVLTPFVNQIGDDLASLPAQPATLKPGETDPREPMLRRLLQPAQTITDYRLATLLLPTSWVSPLDRDLRQSVVKAYDRIAMPAIRSSLSSRLGALGGKTASPPQTYDAEPTYYDKTAEFQDFQTFLSSLHEEERRVDSYNCIATSCTWRGDRLVADFNSLTTASFGEPFRPPAGGAKSFYVKVLKEVSVPAITYPPKGYDFDLGSRATDLNRRFDERLLRRDAIDGDLTELQGELSRLGEQRDAIVSVESYRHLLELINKTQQDLGRPEIAWIAGPQLKLGAAYDQTLAAVHNARFLGPQLAAGFRAAGESGFQDLKVRLKGYSSPYTCSLPGSSTPYNCSLLAQQDGQVQLKLSPGVLQLQAALQGLLGQGFMSQGAESLVTVPQPGQPVLLWDANLLQQAQGQVKPYQDFLAKGLALFPDSLRPQVIAASKERLRGQMVGTIAQAQIWKPRATSQVPDLLEGSLGQQVTSFQIAAPVLSTLEGSLSSLGFPADSARLSVTVDAQRREILAQNDDLLALYELYSVSDPVFSWWQGKPVLAYGAFAVSDSAGLSTYLDTQRQTITRLAETYASPTVGGAGLIAPLAGGRARYWKTILDDLDAYKNKKADNPLQTLETLISQTMTAVTLDTCLAQITPVNDQGGSPDFFLARRSALAAGARSRCLTLVSCKFRQGYEQLSQSFNGRLAGHFPFAAQEPFQAEAQALPEAIAGTYSLFDKYQPYLPQLPAGDPAFGDREGEIRAFMASMAAVRPLFAPFLDTPQQYPVPTLGFTAELRVNQAREVKADEIFHWILDIGDGRYQLGDPAIKGQWSYGSPSSLILIWADNSPDVPVSAESSDWAAVEGRTVSYRYDRPWSLFALIQDSPSAPADFRDPSDNQPETLKLLIKTSTADPKPPIVQTTQAKAFVRVTLTTPDGKTVIPLPDFPEKAAAGAGRCPEGDE